MWLEFRRVLFRSTPFNNPGHARIHSLYTHVLVKERIFSHSHGTATRACAREIATWPHFTLCCDFHPRVMFVFCLAINASSLVLYNTKDNVHISVSNILIVSGVKNPIYFLYTHEYSVHRLYLLVCVWSLRFILCHERNLLLEICLITCILHCTVA